MRRYISATLVTLAVMLVLASSPALARTQRARPKSSWAQAEINLVLARGILPGTTRATFRPNQPLDNGTLAMLVWGAVPNGVNTRLSTRAGPVSIGQLDAAFVAALGLRNAARRVQQGLIQAGYRPRADAGTEVIARALGLRFNHPAGSDQLERFDYEVASRADAAYTTAVVLGGVDSAQAGAIAALAAGLPITTGKRHAALQRAIRLIGAPYVWGGTNATGAGQAHGGFDCSGLVWRVMALDPQAPAGVAAVIGGRTTYDMARTTRRSGRLSRTRMRPGDLIMFGPSGRRSSWQQIGHVGIDLGNGLMVHSSEEGVTLTASTDAWYAQEFAFAKNVLGS